jgi:AraC-like DNA-binding protein
MWRKRGQRTGRKLVILNPKPLWKDLRKLTTRDFAGKYGATRSALTFKLHAMNPSRYEEIMSKRRILPQRQSTPISEETWTLIENGCSVRGIAAEQHVNRCILDRKLWQDPRYTEIIRQRKQDKERRIREAVEQFRRGELLANLSKEHEIAVQELASQIQTILGPKTYNDILEQRRHNPSNKISWSTIKTAATLLKQGWKVIDICREFHIHRKTLRRRLRQLLGNKYDQIIQGRRIPKELIQKLAQLFLKGESLNQLSMTYNVPLQTLHRKLMKTIGPHRYKKIMEQRLLHPGFGTRGAPRSKYETEIEQLLKKHKIPFTRKILPIEGHDYLPDFILYTDPPIIIEATGMNIDSYWIRYKHKLQHYLEAGYTVILIVPDTSVYNKALKYVPRNVLIKLKDFKAKIESLKEAPSGNEFPSESSDPRAHFSCSLVVDQIQIRSVGAVTQSTVLVYLT